MKKLNEKGSIMVMVVSIILLILIVVGICFGIVTSYQKRAVNDHASKQAYLSGLSVAQSIAGQIGNEKNIENYLPATVNEADDVSMTVSSLPDGTSGDITVKIKYNRSNNNILYIQVTSVYNRVTEEVQLTMQKQNNRWYTKIYSKIGDEFSDQE
ncbi:MAG: hypothetical protein RR558_00255 [Coprobacillus sp.]